MVDDRIDPFITDLAAFHPPDFAIVDGIRGLQYEEHAISRPDQMLRNNLVLASEDPVAADALVAQLMGFNPWDIEHLHMAEQREMGTLDLRKAEIAGDDPSRLQTRWGKPKGWYGRGNREWLVTKDPESPIQSWSPFTSKTDTLHFIKWAGSNAGSFAAAVRVRAEGHRKAYLWVGAQGRVAAQLNGEKVLEEENLTRYRIGQFQKLVELRPGENLLVFQMQAPAAPAQAQLSALLVGPRNDGDTVDGIRWTA